ncbi:MAG TPA: hypothetical protein DIW31_04975 [Bacteroidales bacterium]|nr:hypothetical protein [Bacteroidales bacterium]
MRKILLILLAAFTFQALIAQENQQEKGYNQHDGFYLSMGLGPAFGKITDEMVGIGTLDFTGTGAQFDFKIGGAVSENFILHASLISSSIPGPKVSGGGESTTLSNNLSIGESMIGGGFTYYFMPANFFISSSIGSGNFTIIDSKNDINISTKRGLSLQLKVGKEWWVSKNWGLGISLTYGKTKLTNKADGIEEKLNSSRFGILFNATFN